MTLDYGIRFTRQQPQYDQFQQMSNFFPDQWSLNSAPLLYVSAATTVRPSARKRSQRGRSPHRPDPDGAGRSEHGGRRSAPSFRAPGIPPTA
jgi:hypothetical protein